jgi:predicted metal-dependent hydrolase
MADLLRHFGFGQQPLEPAAITVNGRSLKVNFRVNAQAKRLILRLSKNGSEVIVTLPKRASLKSAMAFARKSEDWIASQLAKRPPVRTDTIPLRGHPHRIAMTRERRALIRIEDETIHVPGDEAHAARRLRDWLKQMARDDLTEASLHYAKAMETTVSGISIRDQASRWGSCSAAGKLSYSWRLILAPPFVLDYVAAHEVAHRLHMNHGPKFWRLVLSHCPHVRDAKTWLKHNGRTLHEVLA